MLIIDGDHVYSVIWYRVVSLVSETHSDHQDHDYEEEDWGGGGAQDQDVLCSLSRHWASPMTPVKNISRVSTAKQQEHDEHEQQLNNLENEDARHNVLNTESHA